MTKTAYFCYEKSFCGKYVPVCYHDEKLVKKMEGNIERTALIEVPSDCIDGDDVMFGRLTSLYPPPQDKIDE